MSPVDLMYVAVASGSVSVPEILSAMVTSSSSALSESSPGAKGSGKLYGGGKKIKSYV